jgi:hypothetical protein
LWASDTTGLCLFTSRMSSDIFVDFIKSARASLVDMIVEKRPVLAQRFRDEKRIRQTTRRCERRRDRIRVAETFAVFNYKERVSKVGACCDVAFSYRSRGNNSLNGSVSRFSRR